MKQEIPQPLNGLLAAGGALSIIIAWQLLLPLAGVPSYILPTPAEIARIFSKESTLLWNNFWPTVYEAVMGFLLGNGVAALMAVVFVLNRYIQAAYFPVILFLNTIPILALAPVIVLIFGLGVLPKIIIPAVICFFPTPVNMIRGLESPGSNELELFRVLSASRLETMWKLRLPRAMPFLFASLRISSATAVIGAVVGEWIGSDRGLGAMIIQATFNYQSGRLHAAITLCSFLAFVMFLIVVSVEKLVLNYERH
ncbi:ABC transporter permease [Aestuariivirga sp.]|jgi:NitT/TauT family transport system permease protein|uniref:ABC transporter permease n=1 Tax=Aestuariivirga sp. TaxID=2650926 RepID=UPI00378344CE